MDLLSDKELTERLKANEAPTQSDLPMKDPLFRPKKGF
jgi:hypothetical protein